MHLHRGLLIAGMLAACTFARAETGPQIEFNSKAVRISVTIVPELRKHPGLFDNLLAEGKRNAETNRAEAAKELHDNPGFFTDGREWYFHRNYTLRSEAGRYVSVLRLDETFSGGAHPNSYVDTILWDREGRRRTNIRAFFRETADNGPTMTALARLARLAVAAAKLAKMSEDEEERKLGLTPQQYLERDPQITQGIAPVLLKIGPISLTPSTERGKSAGLNFHYSPYAVGSYAEGPYTVAVPWTAFREHLSPQGVAIFGGQRPADDHDD